MKLYATVLLAACAATACNKGFDDATPSATHTTAATLDSRDQAGVDTRSSLNSAADSARTDEVRNALIAAGTFGNDAVSVNVTTHNGIITLHGTVASEQEKSLMESTALTVAVGDLVDNQLVVANPANAVRGQGTRYGVAPGSAPAATPPN